MRPRDQGDAERAAFDRQLIDQFGPELGRPLGRLAGIRDNATVGDLDMIADAVAAMVKRVELRVMLELEVKGELPLRRRQLRPLSGPRSPDSAG